MGIIPVFTVAWVFPLAGLRGGDKVQATFLGGRSKFHGCLRFPPNMNTFHGTLSEEFRQLIYGAAMYHTISHCDR